MSRHVNKSRSKRSKSKRSKRSSATSTVTNLITNQSYPTGGKTHTKKRTVFGKSSGTSIRVTNSYMNKKGIIRHTRTKNISPFTASL
jgi:hypothetical protein